MALPPTRNRCELCEEFIPPEYETWLEYDPKTETYTDRHIPNAPHFSEVPFCPRCTKRALEEDRIALENL